MDTVEEVQKRSPVLFAHYVDHIRKAGTDNTTWFLNNYVMDGGYSLQQNPDEFASLIVFLKEHVRPTSTYLEVGTASGGAARMLHEELNFATVLSIDDGKHHRWPEVDGNFKNLPARKFVGDSHGPEAKQWLSEQSVRIDVAFIDGDHTWPGVWQDVELVRPYLKSGALIIFHDISACLEVKQAFERGAKESFWNNCAAYIGKEKPLGIGVGRVI